MTRGCSKARGCSTPASSATPPYHVLTMYLPCEYLLGEVQRLCDLAEVLCRVLVEQLLPAALRLVPEAALLGVG